MRWPCASLALLLASCVAGGASVNTGTPPNKHQGARTAAGSGEPIVLPASFERGLIYLKPVTEESGVPMTLLLSSTSRSTLREAKAAELVGGRLEPETTTLILPKMAWDAFIPESRGDEGRFLIASRIGEADPPTGVDGIAGTGFLAERTFTIDFKNAVFLFRAPGEAPFGDSYERINLIPSKRDPKKGPEEPSGTPREDEPPETYALSVSLGGVAHEFVFDLGARINLSSVQAQALGAEPGLSASCVLSPPLFDELAKTLKTFPTTDDPDGEPVRFVEVPSVKVAGKETGPAWFVRDSTSPEEAGIAGRVSGGCLSKLALTIDFRSGLAVVTNP